MKLMTSAAALLLAAGLSAGPAAAQYADSGVLSSTQYVAVDGDGNPVAPGPLINPDGSFDASCVGCEWVPGSPAVGQADYTSYQASVSSGRTGGVTSVEAAGISTPDLTVGGINVGDTLADHGAAITMLNGAVGVAQETADRALASAAIVAAMPQLHFGPGDWLSVGAGGAALSDGPGAGAVAVGALLTPSFMLAAKAGWSDHDAAVYAVHGSWSFGGSRSSYPLK